MTGHSKYWSFCSLFAAALLSTAACSSRSDSAEESDPGGQQPPPKKEATSGTCTTASPTTSATQECSAKAYECGDLACTPSGAASPVTVNCGTCSPDKECTLNKCVLLQSGPPQGSESPSDIDDKGDMDGTNGTPALDIIATQSFLSGGQPWVRVRFAAPWPPEQVVSYSAKVTLLDGAKNAGASLTTQLQAGTTSIAVSGVAKEKVKFIAETNGFRVLFGDASLAHDFYSAETRVKKTSGSPEATDQAGPHPFSTTETGF